MDTLTILDKQFKISITEKEILEAVKNVANQLNFDLKNKEVVFLGILNGAFMFVSDLMKHIEIPVQISFLKVASYEGTATTGKVKQLIGVNENIENKTVVILEDIVDTGYTMQQIIADVQKYNPGEIRIATLLFKPTALKVPVNIDYVAITIPDDFVVGYGLDYEGFGRNLNAIYTVI